MVADGMALDAGAPMRGTGGGRGGVTGGAVSVSAVDVVSLLVGDAVSLSARDGWLGG